jgi:hypothetical protein
VWHFRESQAEKDLTLIWLLSGVGSLMPLNICLGQPAATKPALHLPTLHTAPLRRPLLGRLRRRRDLAGPRWLRAGALWLRGAPTGNRRAPAVRR